RRFKQPVMPMERLRTFVRDKRIKIAILTVPAIVAQEVTNKLVAAGITGILNFSPIMLQVPEHVSVNNVNLASELENLSYFIKR
ncbi:MAG: redox-sensing transcriptional repressor Rex, partial [Verrucomicrobiae bacterium]|nr:redox-sensing transcriptional repressor Rex [Verrucomicrobiae bacterium]